MNSPPSQHLRPLPPHHLKPALSNPSPHHLRQQSPCHLRPAQCHPSHHLRPTQCHPPQHMKPLYSHNLHAPPAMSSPPASVLPSPLSRKAKRKRLWEQNQQDEERLNTLGESRTNILQNKEEDEEARFAATVADVLRHMPPETRHEGKRILYNVAVDLLNKALNARPNVNGSPL